MGNDFGRLEKDIESIKAIIVLVAVKRRLATQRDIARALNMDQSDVSRLMTGKLRRKERAKRKT